MMIYAAPLCDKEGGRKLVSTLENWKRVREYVWNSWWGNQGIDKLILGAERSFVTTYAAIPYEDTSNERQSIYRATDSSNMQNFY